MQVQAGAQVAPDAGAPTPKRLYELTVGQVTAASAGPCSISPPMYW